MAELVVRVQEAARLALVCGPDGRTRWVPYSPDPQGDALGQRRPLGPGRVLLPGQTALPSRAAPAQRPAGAKPAAVSARPRRLPRAVRAAWRANGAAPNSLEAARDYVWKFLGVLHDKYGWSYSRLFVFAFSQGACVTFHLAMTLPRDVRLGGVVLVSGGAIVGPHEPCSGLESGGAAATPMLQVTGAADAVYPAALAERSRREFKRRHPQQAAAELFTSLVRPRKGHAMIDSREDMQHAMLFFSKYLYLRNVDLENRSDVIELQT
ncbi:hypothetical protein ON010_g217 [Phytophthora cinnamomi]|nr:hypothetical protein ON010_g217 [Phytophthora cinnamomi]